MDVYERIKRNKKNVSPRDLIELLTAFGYVKRKSAGGDHEQYKRPGCRPFPVPICQDSISIRIVGNALRAIEEIIEADKL